MLKRSGCGHTVDGVIDCKPGDCAVLCPACPYPGINMPEDVKEIPIADRYVNVIFPLLTLTDIFRWLFAVFIAIDANFRLRRKDVSNVDVDPSLNRGRAFVVERGEFRKHLEEFGSQKDEKSTCSNHDAIKSASIRGGRGTAASGMGSAQCGRHDMKRPCGVGDLQKGERCV